MKKTFCAALLLMLTLCLLCLTASAEPNTQTYTAQDGTTHTIHWAQGVVPPKMTSDPALLGTDGYFDKIDTENGNTHQVYYNAPGNMGSGYYDLNKNFSSRGEYEQNLCYLATGVNLLHWWMDRNQTSIDAYVAGIQDGTYASPEGLTDITRPGLWEALRAPVPFTAEDANLMRRELYSSGLIQQAFRTNYYTYPNGNFADRVIDFFVNGYPACDSEVDQEPNRESQYEMDRRGGFFYPIFGKTLLTHRHRTGSYAFYRDNLAQWLDAGYGLGISYHMGTYAHAVALWGVEYDADGELCRFFITDSDDAHNAAYRPYPGYSQGLESFEIVQIEGLAYLSNDLNHSERPTTMLLGVTTLSPGTEIWEQKLKDTTPPAAPQVEKAPEGCTYAVGSVPVPLSVTASVSDTGYLTYEWYCAEDAQSAGQPLDCTDPVYTPDTSRQGTFYYYCRVTNHKNGKENTTDSPRALIRVADVEVVNAQQPRVGNVDSEPKPEPPQTYPHVKHFYRGTPVTLKVSASVTDGGTLTYQWYRSSDSSTANGSPIVGATQDRLQIPTNSEGRFHYFCRVTNTNTASHITGSRVVTRDSTVNTVYIDPPDPSRPLQIGGIPEAVSYGMSFTPTCTGGSEAEPQWSVLSGPAVLEADGSVTVTGIGSITLQAAKPGSQPVQTTFIAESALLGPGTLTLAPKVYDGTVQAQVLTLTLSYPEKGEAPVLGRDYTVLSAQFDSADAGTEKTVTVQLALQDPHGNYRLPQGGLTFEHQEIQKAVVTVTAQDLTIRAGDSLPVFSFNHSPLPMPDRLTEVEFRVETDGKTPGTFAVTPEGGRILPEAHSGNYTLVYVPGTLTVEQKAPEPAGWQLDADGLWVYLEQGRPAVSCWRQDSAGWLYLDDTGHIATEEWRQDSRGWCYLGTDGRMVRNAWVLDSIDWCFLDADGYMVTDTWALDSQGWCYLGTDGRMVRNAWALDSKDWCFLDANGHMVTDTWALDSQGWCYLDSTGHLLRKGFASDSTGEHYLDASGHMVY